MDVTLPKLGEGADSGVVVNLLVKVGDQLKEGQAIIELENEKAIAPIPSTVSGTVTKIRVQEGDKISVGQVILSVDTRDTAAEPRPAREKRAGEGPKPKPPEPVAAEDVDEAHKVAETLPRSEAEVAASPSVRKLGRDLGIDLTRIRGSERGGRIVLADLRGYIQRLQMLDSQPGATAAAPAKAKLVAAERIDFSKWGETTRKPLSQLRRVIGQRMAESWAAVPRVTQFDEADLTVLMELRKKYQAAYEAKGARLTVTPFALKAVVATLQKHPVFNSSLDEAAGEVVLKGYFHIGVAVDTEAGLLVPVIRDVDKKSLLQLAQELEDLAAKARGRKLALDEMKGGTFTISNQGGIGGAHFTPIINLPEVAILGVGRGAMKAVVKDKQIQQRLLLPIAISYDHRVIDGGGAARFAVDLVKALEDFPEAEVKV